jgi:spore coat protein CotF
MNLSEKDSINDLLIQEKELIKVYGTFLPEGSTSQLRNILKKNMDVVAQQQYEVFSTMKSKGYYDMKNAESQQINETKKKFSKSASSN